MAPLSGIVSSFPLPCASYCPHQLFAAHSLHILLPPVNFFFRNHINTLTTGLFTACCHPLLKHEPEDALPDSCFEDLPCDPSTTTNSQPQPPSTPSTTHTKPSHTPKPPTNPGSTPTNPPYEPPSTTSTSHQHTTTSESGGGGGGGDGAWHGDAYGTYFLQEGRAGCVLVQPALAACNLTDLLRCTIQRVWCCTQR